MEDLGENGKEVVEGEGNYRYRTKVVTKQQ